MRVAVEESQLLVPLVTINTDNKIILPKHSESVILNWTLLNFSLTYFHCESPARCSPASFSVFQVWRATVEIVSLSFRGPLFLLLYNTIRDALLAGHVDLFSRSYYRKQKRDCVGGLYSFFPSLSFSVDSYFSCSPCMIGAWRLIEGSSYWSHTHWFKVLEFLKGIFTEFCHKQSKLH